MENLLEYKIAPLLRKHGLTLATAESCTGGIIANRITNVPGCSDYFLGGVVAYADEAKIALLHVLPETLSRHGAVSREVVIEMARGIRAVLGSHIGISVSGIAGPGGGSPEKPVGTTWIGLSTAEADWARHFCWQGDRLQNKTSSAEAALQFVIDYLEGKLTQE
jgi:PncC family amidohydrolase